jgi:hypothetical protein
MSGCPQCGAPALLPDPPVCATCAATPEPPNDPSVTFFFDCPNVLTRSHLYPDGDGPSIITAEAIATMIRARHSRINQWVSEWNLDVEVSVSVDGGPEATVFP